MRIKRLGTVLACAGLAAAWGASAPAEEGGGPNPPPAKAPVCIDEALGIWRTLLPAMKAARCDHAAVRLEDGRILVSGGDEYENPGAGRILASSEILDLKAGAWTAAASMSTARRGHGMCLLADGRVLAVGGRGAGGALASVEIYDPRKDAWGKAAPLAEARAYFSLCRLPDGRVLVAGGAGGNGDLEMRGKGTVLSSAELFDPKAGTWTKSEMRCRRAKAGILALPDGRVLLCGGLERAATEGFRFPGNRCGPCEEHPLRTAEAFDPAKGVWEDLPPMPSPHGACRLMPLDEGRLAVLRDPGMATEPGENEAEAYDPVKRAWSVLRIVPLTTGGPALVASPWGGLLLAGGDVLRVWQGGARDSLPEEDWYSVSVEGPAVLVGDGKILLIGGGWSGRGIAGGCVLATSKP